MDRLTSDDYEKITLEYGITDDIVIKLLRLSLRIETEKHKVLKVDELIPFLKSVINCDEINSWAIQEELANRKVTLNEKIKRFFKIKQDQDIINLYDPNKNYNEEEVKNTK